MTGLLALGASVLWGCADFLGGTVARKVSPVAVAGAAQGIGFIVMLLVGVVGGVATWHGPALAWGAVAGVCALVGLALMYGALAKGTMGVIAPIIAMSSTVPIVAGLLGGDRLGPVRMAGLVACVSGVVLASLAPSRARPGPAVSVSRLPVLLAVVAAAVFGVSLVLLAMASRSDAFTGALAMRGSAAATAATAALIMRSTGNLRQAPWPALMVLGVLDACAYLAFGLATAAAALTVVAVLSSLYPVITILLARIVHSERLRPLQVVGVIVCLGGVLAVGL